MSQVQFTGSLEPNVSELWFTYDWPTDRNVAWVVMPTTPRAGDPMIEWTVETERSANDALTYWITIRNLTGDHIDFEARYSYLD
jgi:hypothetical protein